MILAELPASFRDVVRRSGKRAVFELGFAAARPALVELAFVRLVEELDEPLADVVAPAVAEAVDEAVELFATWEPIAARLRAERELDDARFEVEWQAAEKARRAAERAEADRAFALAVSRLTGGAR